MNPKASPPAIESAAALTAALCLAGAVGFAVLKLAPGSYGAIEAGVVAVLVAVASWLVLGRVDRHCGVRQMAFAPIDFPDAAPADDEVLLLDDPLPAAAHNCSIVRLHPERDVESFPAMTAAVAPVALPGDMVARIEDFLGNRSPAPERTQAAANLPSADASAALHAALADIRRSLRHG